MMKDQFEIRPMQKEDVAFIVNLVRTSFNDEYLIPSIYRGKGIAQFLENEIENQFSPYRYFVVWAGDSIAGYSEYKIFESSSTAFLNIIATDNKYKNKGIGRILFQNTKDFFKKSGYKNISLDVYKSNTVALKWYDGFGFKNIDANILYKIHSDVKMVKHVFSGKLQNYPQFKILRAIYGFYFLDITFEKEIIKMGLIDNDLIVRGTFSNSLNQELPHLIKVLNLENAYFVGAENLSKELEFIDKIIRMELKLNI